jgi:hypothetical protein
MCKDLRIRHAQRQWGACWMSALLWEQLRLDEFWSAALPPSREGTSWLNILKTLVSYQLISPGSEWRLHRHWFEHSAMGDFPAFPGCFTPRCGEGVGEAADVGVPRKAASNSNALWIGRGRIGAGI